MINLPVLVLNQSYEPLNICRVRRAVVLLYQSKAEMLENGSGFIHSAHFEFPVPSVIRLAFMVKRPPRFGRKLTRLEVFKRDHSTCQYCGKETRQLTLDHVIQDKQRGVLPEFKQQKDMTFDSFDWKRVNLPLEQRQNLEAAFRLAREFAKSPDGWLVLLGDNGCGKTHLAAAIVNYRYQAKSPALFIVVPDFLDHLRSTFSPESKISYDQLFESVKNAPLLVLDDFGKQTTTAWAQEKLYQVINYRYNARLPTVITTNCSTDEMDSPISSRFADPKISVLFNITAPDYWAGRPSPKRTSRSSKSMR